MRYDVYRCGDCNKILSDENSSKMVAIPHVHIKGLVTIAYRADHSWLEAGVTLSGDEYQFCIECFTKALERTIEMVKRKGDRK